MSRRFAPAGLLLMTLALGGCSDEKHDADRPEPVRPVLSVVVAPEASRLASFAGTIESRYTADLSFRILGRVTSRPVETGDSVKKGETLATLDDTALSLAVQSAQADYSGALAQLANADANDRRLEKLQATGSIARADYEAAHEAALRAKANAERSKSALDKAEEQLSYARLSADFDAVVTGVGADVGQTVSAGQTVVSVARPDQGEAVVDIPDALIGGFREGDRFEIVLQALPAVTATGSLREIAPQSDSATRTRRVRIALEAPPPAFRLGATITASAHSQAANGVRLPLSALLESDGATQVWIVDPGSQTVALRAVTVGARDGDGFMATSGLNAGDRVVTAGVHSLKNGQKVRVDGAAS
ncbi:MAG: efflux RND transporter periplasmic adaptor subunit [Rhizobiaceae bacterium]|nr:efflux RND transporter periplasmic adaptor subunit [Rhizobiaceae bacterium]